MYRARTAGRQRRRSSPRNLPPAPVVAAFGAGSVSAQGQGGRLSYVCRTVFDDGAEHSYECLFAKRPAQILAICIEDGKKDLMTVPTDW